MYHVLAGGRPQLFILHPGIRVLLLAGEMQLQSVTVPLTWNQRSIILSTSPVFHQQEQQIRTVQVSGKARIYTLKLKCALKMYEMGNR